jgi:transcriptional regulator with XRE-family HTH domain
VPLLTALRPVRELRAWSQRDRAARAGVAQATIVGLEGGRRVARQITTRKLTAALGVEPAELIPGGQDIKMAT